MNEHKFSRKLKDQLAKRDPSLFWWKVNDTFAGGVPDIFLEGSRSDLWAEVKYIPALPKRATTVIDLADTKRYLSKLQQLWLERREARRGDTLVLVGHPNGVALFWHNSWKTPLKCGDFITKSVSFKEAIEQIVCKVN